MRFLVLLLMWIHVISSKKQVRLITFTTGNANPATGYEVVTAAVDVALARAAVIYPRVVENLRRSEYFAKNISPSCTDMEAYTVSGLHVLLGSNISHTREKDDEIRVVITPGCSFEIIDIGDFAREADVLVIASTASVAVLKNKQRFPTTLAMAATSFADAAQAAYKFLMRNRWSRVNLLCEKYDANSSKAIVNFASEIFYGIIARTLQSQQATVNFIPRPFNPERSSTVRSSLLASKTFSTVNLLVTTCPDFKNILDTADDLGMATGEYVFLIFCWNGFSELHQDLFDKMQRVPDTLGFSFIASFGDINWTNMDSDMDIINNISAVKYGYEVPDDTEPQITILSVYECVFMLVKMLNETWDAMDNISGRTLASRFFDRTFDLPSRAISVAHDGTRVCDILFKQFRSGRKVFETVFVYYAVGKVARPFGNRSVSWSKLPFPPSYVPLCGFENERCQSTGNTVLYYFFFVVPVAVVVGLAIRKLRARSEFSWYIPAGDVSYEAAHLHVSKSTTKFSLKRKSAISTLIQARWIYKGQSVISHEIRSGVAFVELVRNKTAVSLLDTVSKLESPNIAKFFGLHWMLSDPAVPQASCKILVLSQRGEKGSLDDLLRHEDISLSWDLRFAIIADILQGLDYIHRSAVRYHDTLNPTCITVDKRFGVLIGDIAMERLRNALKGDPDPELSLKELWKPPEQILDGVTATNAVAGNMYGLGAILYEIATRKIPILPKATEQDHGAEILFIWGDSEVTEIKEAIPAEVTSIVQDCCSVIPQRRPTVQDILRKLGSLLPSHGSSLIDRLSERLSQYNQELEKTVRDRNENLLEEMKRVDEVLSELLPREVISRLRKSEVIEPEYFGSVSVLFSGVPVFDHIVNSNPPLTVVALLHDLYSTVDKLLPRYDVYKVESIKDTYMIASGLPVITGANHAVELAELALDMMTSAEKLSDKYGTKGMPPIQMRIGIHSGPCVAGVIGLKLPHYLLFGDTVNTASRMETTGLASQIQISSSTRSLVLLRNTFVLTSRGFINIKGKGSVETFWLSE